MFFAILQPIRPNWQARSNDNPDCSEAGLLFLMAVCVAFSALAFAWNAGSSDRSKGQAFGATTSFSFDHLSPVTVCADDHS